MNEISSERPRKLSEKEQACVIIGRVNLFERRIEEAEARVKENNYN